MRLLFNYFTLAPSRKSCWLKLYINFDYCCVLQQTMVEKLYTYQMLGYKRIVMYLTIKQKGLCHLCDRQIESERARRDLDKNSFES
jgi:hypothetical protein